MRKALYLSVAALSALALAGCSQQDQAKQPKYVFYFITDGTGINTVQGTEFYMAETTIGKPVRKPLLMSTFPVVGVASTYSASSGVTDSAASGTALATGVKTYNGALGVDSDTTAVYGIAEWAKTAGMAVGIGTSVSINHATPGAFFAHSSSRNDYYYIGTQAAATGFDFFGGCDFQLDSRHRDESFRDSIYQMCTEAGYVLARSTYADYEAKAADAERIIFIQDRERTMNVNQGELPYNLDAQPGELSVYDITRAEIDFLYRKSQQNGNKGFFLMNEIGGMVDHACHSNDAMTAFSEVMLVDSCLQLAYDFYLQHPDETLIVLTSDHETGGLTIGNAMGGYATNMKPLASQKYSVDMVTKHLQALRATSGNRVSWEDVKECLKNDFGFWDTVEINDTREAMLKQIYTMSFVGKMPNEDNLYTSHEPMASAALRMMQEIAHMGWTSPHHTAGLVPVYAIGVGAEKFMGHNDNAEIPLKIAEIAGYKVEQRK